MKITDPDIEEGKGYYNGHRGPNLSQYLRELRTIPSDITTEDTFGIEDDLVMFTNSQFFNFDLGENTDYQALPGKLDSGMTPSSFQQESPSAPNSVTDDFAGLDIMSGEYEDCLSSDCNAVRFFHVLFIMSCSSDLDIRPT
jgi:hypothetical protein